MPSSQNGSQKSTLAVTPSGLNNIDSLLSSIQWAPNFNGITTLTYSFPWAQASKASWATNPNYSSDNKPNNAFALTTAQQQAVRDALATWSQVANVTFTEVSDTASNVGDLRFAWTTLSKPGVLASAYLPSSYWASGGDVWLRDTGMGSETGSSWQPGGSAFSTLIHETGHALGLKHPFDDTPTLPKATDTNQYSVMSYNPHPHSLFSDAVFNAPRNIEPQTPMLYDIAAIQYLYGANTSHRTGNDTYTFDPNKPFFQTLWDAGGIDTISVSNFSTDCYINLEDGGFSNIGAPANAVSSNSLDAYNGTNNFAIAFGCLIENATGGQGNDVLIGNAANNLLRGGSGNDRFFGGAGDDIFDGGAGTDMVDYYYARAAVDVDLGTGLATGGEGTDSLIGIENIYGSQ